MSAVYPLGAIAVMALVATAVYLWFLLRDFSLARRAANLLLPVSQLACVIYAICMAVSYEWSESSALFVAVVGIVCAVCDPLLYRTMLRAERVERERQRARLLEEQVEAQAGHLAQARRAEAQAADVRQRLDDELALLDQALASGDDAAAREHLVGAEKLVSAPGERACQHPAADALLMAKVQRCRERGIRLEIDAEIPADLATPAVELCAVLANALDNAIAACEALPEDERWVTLKARRAHGLFSVVVENACAKEAVGHRQRKGGRGAREGRGGLPEHGWGQSIIEGVVRRHDGEMACRREGSRYHMDVIWKA